MLWAYHAQMSGFHSTPPHHLALPFFLHRPLGSNTFLNSLQRIVFSLVICFGMSHPLRTSFTWVPTLPHPVRTLLQVHSGGHASSLSARNRAELLSACGTHDYSCVGAGLRGVLPAPLWFQHNRYTSWFHFLNSWGLHHTWVVVRGVFPSISIPVPCDEVGEL